MFGIVEIMAGILQTTGPLSTVAAVKRVKMSLNTMMASQFVEAAEELERVQLGRLVTVPSSVARAKVFIKKPPHEVEAILIANPGLCTPEVYATRYAKQTSKAIGLQLRAALVAKKYVTQKQVL